MKVELKRIRNNAKIPSFQTDGAAAVDLHACIGSSMMIAPDECVLIPTGFAVHLADKNTCAVIIPRSSLGHKFGMVLGNGVGLIDSDYTGEIFVSLKNTGNSVYTVRPDDRIAQMLFLPVFLPSFEVVKEFSGQTERGDGGFGSTGV